MTKPNSISNAPWRTQFLTWSVILLVLLLTGISADAQLNPINFLGSQYGTSTLYNSTPAGGGPLTPTLTSYYDINITQQPPSPASAELYATNSGTITQGDLVVVTVSYRRADAYSDFNLNTTSLFTPYSSSTNANTRNGLPIEANIILSVHGTASPYACSLSRALRGRGEWRTVTIPFIAGETFTAGQETFSIQMGTQTQEIQIGGFTATDYGQKSIFGAGSAVDQTSTLTQYGSSSNGTITTVTAGVPPIATQDAFTTAQDLLVTSATTGFGLTKTNIPGTSFTANDTLVAIFWLRDANVTTNFPFSFVRAMFQENDNLTNPPSYPKWQHSRFTVDGNWKQFIVPFTLPAADAGQTYTFTLDIGYQLPSTLLQHVQIAGFNILDLGQGGTGNPPTVNNLTTDIYDYPGQSLTDPWRATALVSINKYRKGTFDLDVSTTVGNPLQGITVNANLANPLFGFGSAVDSDTVTGQSSIQGTNLTNYQTAVRSLFNKVSTENNLKWTQWENPAKASNYGTNIAIEGINWFRNNGITNIRGHNVIWPAFVYTTNNSGVTPPDVYNYVGNTTTLESRIAGTGATSNGTNYPGHIPNEVGNTNIVGKLTAWDAVNEPFDNNTIYQCFEGRTDTVGYVRTLAEDQSQPLYDASWTEPWLTAIKTADPFPDRYINENGLEANFFHLFGDNTTFNSDNPEEYYLYQLVSALANPSTLPVNASTNAITGFGFESHFQTSNGNNNGSSGLKAYSSNPLTPPLMLKQVFDEFAAIPTPYDSSGNTNNFKEEATEFDQDVYHYDYKSTDTGNHDSRDSNAPATDLFTEFQYMNFQALQADYLTDYMTMVFSEPHFNSFTSWGFWDGDGEDWPDCNTPLYNADWSLKPSGLAWVSLVKNLWSTPPGGASSTASDSTGLATLEGYLGRYNLTATNGSITKTYWASMTLSGDSGEDSTIEMELNGSSGDYNVWLDEAENGVLENGATSHRNAFAYGLYYVTGTGYGTAAPPAGYIPDIRIDLDPVTEADTGYVWVRYYTPDSTGGDAQFYYNLNGGAYTTVGSLGTKGWNWVRLNQNQFTVPLAAGAVSSIGIVTGGAPLEIDQILVTDDPAFAP